jgi:hypothetical protein
MPGAGDTVAILGKFGTFLSREDGQGGPQPRDGEAIQIPASKGRFQARPRAPGFGDGDEK